MGYIYKIVNNVNDKLYIGQTNLVNPVERFKQHIKDMNKRTTEKRPLYNAIKKIWC